MLRALVVALLVANVAFFTWSSGWLDGIIGARSIGDREPERLSRQVRPGQIRLLPPGAASAAAIATTGAGTLDAATPASAPAAATLTCLEAGPFSDAELGAAQRAAQAALSGVELRVVKTERPGVWMVYMGRYLSRELVTKKIDELKRRRLQYEEIREPAALAPGLSLGRFDQREAAMAALAQFGRQGIQTARVIEYASPSTASLLRIDQADAALAARATALSQPALAKGFAACAKP